MDNMCLCNINCIYDLAYPAASCMFNKTMYEFFACCCSCHGTIDLYVDDERTTPNGWFRVYNINDAIYWIKSGRVANLSLDNDLGSLDPKTEGFNVLNFLEETVYNDPTFPIPKITIHSSNAGRVPAMKQVANRLEIIRQQQIDNQK